MRRFINFLFIAGAVVGVFYLIGLITPRSMSTEVTGRLVAFPRDVGKVMADVAGWPGWHPTVESVRERELSKSKKPVWGVRDTLLGDYDVEIVLAEDTRWNGTWEIEGERFTLRVEARGYGEDRTQVLILCQRLVSDPWKRAARLLWGTRVPIDDLLKGLGKALRSEVEYDR